METARLALGVDIGGVLIQRAEFLHQVERLSSWPEALAGILGTPS